MSRSRLRDVDLIPKNKSTLLCILFVVIYFTRKSSAKDNEKGSVKDPARQSLISRTIGPGKTELWVPYKDGERRTIVSHVSQDKFDDDYAKFSRTTRHFGGEARAILSILIPKYRSRIVGFLVLHMGLLGLRTYMSLIVADLDGRIVRHLIGANGPAFVSGLIEWLVLAVPASYTNAMIRYLEGKISIEFRGTLVRYIHDLYIGSNQEYYKANSIDGALEGIDHYITSDVAKFCSSAAKLYASIGKPSLDLCVFSYKLSRNLGGKTLLAIFLNYFATAATLKYISPPFGRLAAAGTKLEGDYRNAHSRVITNAEEIAFYDGAAVEKKSLKDSFDKVASHAAAVIRTESLYSIVESYVLKYSWSASGFLFTSIPVYFPALLATASSSSGLLRSSSSSLKAALRIATEKENIGRFITNKRIMMSVSDAGGRIMYSIKDLAELAGYTRRVYQLLSTLHRVRKQAYRRAHGKVIEGRFTLADVVGKLDLTSDDVVSFKEVPVVVPGLGSDLSDGEVLLNPLTFEITAGQNLLIIGSNGTGKSSIARLAAGMWPIYHGLLKRSKNVAFLPQRPYFPWGTLRDQIIYPRTYGEVLEAGVTDADLIKILERVHLAYLPEREGGLDVNKEWKDVFSGGEKQRMLFARVLFENPKFAVIDEGTSAVSADMEGQLYEECKAQGITLLTISHRISLLKYHDVKLEVGLGNDGLDWSLDDSSSSQSWSGLDKEIEHVKTFLKTVPELQARRKEVVSLLEK